MEFEDNLPLERVFVLLYGEIEVEFNGKIVKGTRSTYTNDTIWSVNLPKDIPVKLRGIAKESEIAVIRTENERNFMPVIRAQDDIVEEVRGQGFMNEAGTRIVRTAQDVKLSPESNIMFGEDMHYPGKWSGFPSHSHAQPEIYFYKFYPQNGFGLLRLGEEGVLLEHNDTVLIEPNKVHPQVAAPGYAMYYLWIIRHLDGNPYIKPDLTRSICGWNNPAQNTGLIPAKEDRKGGLTHVGEGITYEINLEKQSNDRHSPGQRSRIWRNGSGFKQNLGLLILRKSIK